MRSKIIALLCILSFCMGSSLVHAASYTVLDITKDSPIRFTPGISTLYNKCTFNWGGLKAWPIESFFEGVSSYRVDTVSNAPYADKCFNLVTELDDVVKVDIPYVNQAAFEAYATPPELGVSKVVTASTDTVGSIFTVKESEIEVNETLISAGTYGTPNYFHCVLPTDSLTLQWLMMAGIDKEIAKGYILSMQWVTSERTCANISMTLDQSLLSEPLPPAPAPTPEPEYCPIDCIPQ